MSSQIVINGVTYAGNNIVVANGRVTVDGVDNTPGEDKNISIIVHGDINSLKANSCKSLIVEGSVKNLENMNGNVDCEDVTGSVKAMNGSVHCKNVAGSVEAMNGNVNYK